MNSLNRNRLQSRNSNNNNTILIVMAIFSLSIIGTTTAAFSPFDRIQVKAAAPRLDYS
jgi:hypothetical protein